MYSQWPAAMQQKIGIKRFWLGWLLKWFYLHSSFALLLQKILIFVESFIKNDSFFLITTAFCILCSQVENSFHVCPSEAGYGLKGLAERGWVLDFLGARCWYPWGMDWGQLEQLQRDETPDDGISLLSKSKRVCIHLCGTCTLCGSAVLVRTAAFTQQVRLLHRW